MSRKQYTLVVASAIIAGLIGGMVSGQMFEARPLPYENIIRAEAFELVDADGNIYAELKPSNQGPALRMFDGKGSTADQWVGSLGGASAAGLYLISSKYHSIKLKAREGEAMVDLQGINDSGMRLCGAKYGPYISLFDEQGDVLWSAPGTQSGRAIEEPIEEPIEESIRHLRTFNSGSAPY